VNDGGEQEREGGARLPVPLAAFFGHHKCASTWVHLMLQEVAAVLRRPYHLAHDVHGLPGSTVASARRALGFDVLSYVNADWRRIGDIDLRGVHLIRDPRDLVVSAYYSHLASHPSGGWDELERIRALLRSTPLETGLLIEIEFLAEVMEELRSWPASVPKISTFRFEAVVAAPRRSFDEMLRHLGLRDDLPDQEFDRIVDQFAFESLTHGRQRGVEDRSHHYRRGVAGEWRRIFTPAVAWVFQRRHGDLLVQLGYEPDDRWTARVGESETVS
jgi:hypothetical protein